MAAERSAVEREHERRERDAVRRPKDAIVGSGKLCREIADAAVAAGVSINELTVLSPQNVALAGDTSTDRGHRPRCTIPQEGL
jgi:hypothetical protein